MSWFRCGARGRQVCRRWKAIHGCAFGATTGPPRRSDSRSRSRTVLRTTRVRTGINRNCMPTLRTAIHAAIQNLVHTAPQAVIRKPIQAPISAKVQSQARNSLSKFKGIGGAAVRSLQRQQNAEDATIQAAGDNPTNRRWVSGRVCLAVGSKRASAARRASRDENANVSAPKRNSLRRSRSPVVDSSSNAPG
jgi:hypothetical protein